eukprot:GDKI01014189.1.p1 GENE.GDKI01014189.1~~GDKI01014189.1.p1  ORF type:complete len:456 (+),score=136.57 GDKI01014189.1:107-1474(+)
MEGNVADIRTEHHPPELAEAGKDGKGGEQQAVVEEVEQQQEVIDADVNFRDNPSKLTVAANTLISLLVLVQMIVLTLRTDEVGSQTAYDIIELLVSVVFCIHMAAEVYYDGWKKFIGDPINIIDFFIVSVGTLSVIIVEMGLNSVTDEQIDKASGLYTAAYVFRWIRSTRCIIAFYQIFKPVRLLIRGIVNAYYAMIWVTGLLFLITFVLSILLTGIIQEKVAEKLASDPNSLSADDLEFFDKWFGTVDNTMFTLYTVMTGDSWISGIGRTCMNKLDAPGIEWYFIMHQVLTTFGILNVIVGVFVEQTFEIAKTDAEEMLKAKLEEAKQASEDILQIFTEADQDGSGELSPEEFDAMKNNPVVTEKLTLMDIDEKELNDLYNILKQNSKDGNIKAKAFTEGLTRMKQGVQAIDMLQLHYSHQRLLNEMVELEKQQEITLRNIREKLSRVVQKAGL